jgi:hypothetical protein
MKSTRFAARHVVRRKDRRAGTPTLLSGAKIPSFPVSLRRKTAAAVLGAALGALSALPALAAEDPDDQPSSSNRTPGISFEAPTPAPGAVLTGVQKVVVKVRADEFTVLQALKLSLVSDDPSIPPFVHEVAPKGFDGTRDQTIQLDWNTAQLTPRNGAYKLVAWGKACDFNNCGFDVSESSVSVTGLKVNNAPAAPQGVKAAIQGAAPLVSWVPAPEPDVKRYHVMRTTGGAAQLVGTTTATSFSDPCSDALPCPAGANLAYQVVAVRSSPVSANGVLSAASAAVSPRSPAGAGAGCGRRGSPPEEHGRPASGSGSGGSSPRPRRSSGCKRGAVPAADGPGPRPATSGRPATRSGGCEASRRA